VFRQKSVLDLLGTKGFTVSAEVFPPRNGKPPELILGKLEALSGMGVDFISVTKGAMGSMRGGTVPIGYMIPDRFGMNALVHFRCRDMDRREVENLLVDHMYFGTRNILAILGDPLPGQRASCPNPETHNQYASDLVRQIADMNRGLYIPLKDGDRPRSGLKTDFCIGVACYPEAEDPGKELFVIGEKAKAGAHFAITQMVFSSTAYGEYRDRLRAAGIGIPVIPGIRPLTAMEHVRAAKEHFHANVPASLERALANATGDEADRICLEFTVDLIDGLRRAGAPGVHMFTLNDVEMIRHIMDKI
jgi:methylenetetrahydrofolate reductase (NADPH)